MAYNQEGNQGELYNQQMTYNQEWLDWTTPLL